MKLLKTLFIILFFYSNYCLAEVVEANSEQAVSQPPAPVKISQRETPQPQEVNEAPIVESKKRAFRFKLIYGSASEFEFDGKIENLSYNSKADVLDGVAYGLSYIHEMKSNTLFEFGIQKTDMRKVPTGSGNIGSTYFSYSNSSSKIGLTLLEGNILQKIDKTPFTLKIGLLYPLEVKSESDSDTEGSSTVKKDLGYQFGAQINLTQNIAVEVDYQFIRLKESGFVVDGSDSFYYSGDVTSTILNFGLIYEHDLMGF